MWISLLVLDCYLTKNPETGEDNLRILSHVVSAQFKQIIFYLYIVWLFYSCITAMIQKG